MVDIDASLLPDESIAVLFPAGRIAVEAFGEISTAHGTDDRDLRMLLKADTYPHRFERLEREGRERAGAIIAGNRDSVERLACRLFDRGILTTPSAWADVLEGVA